MKYSLREDGRSGPPPGQRRGLQGGVESVAAPPPEQLLATEDALSLSRTLDQLTREVLLSNRPLDEAWEELRGQVERKVKLSGE